MLVEKVSTEIILLGDEIKYPAMYTLTPIE